MLVLCHPLFPKTMLGSGYLESLLFELSCLGLQMHGACLDLSLLRLFKTQQTLSRRLVYLAGDVITCTLSICPSKLSQACWGHV